jgi:hypothetical protein
VRFLRALLLVKLGFWAGTFASAQILKRAFPSRGDAESDVVSLVAIMDGITLKSRSPAFRGGSAFTWFGGIDVDLTEASLAPDAHLDVRSLFGGIAIRVPPEWHVVSEATAIAGGIAVDVREPDVDAPTLRITGSAAFGGIAVGAKRAD